MNGLERVYAKADGGGAGMRGPLEVDAVIFDLGNTLAGGSDTPQAFRASIEAVVRRLKEMGVEVDARRLAKARLENRSYFNSVRASTMREVLGEEWMRKDLEDAGVEVDGRVVEEALKAHVEAVVSMRFAYPDAEACLEALSSLGYRMAVVSNVSVHEMAEETLRRLGLDRYFEALVTSASVGWRKPHPAIFNEALRRLKVEAEGAAFVGDDPWADVYGAKSVGMKAIWLRRRPQPEPPTRPDVEVSSLSEVPPLLVKRRSNGPVEPR
ncbi:hypothetical protein B6U99_03620 [Candidatus Geothermarchaeota archaeon ex4572_27]|nr:MAG: hypothetical protein B6U99_03620 [Candidatus Geothermarchaeota archaeon ex4572_27]